MKLINTLLFAVFITLLCAPQSALAEVAIIVNPANTGGLDKEAIKRLFLGKQIAFPDGSPASPCAQEEDSAIAEEFNSKVLGRTANQMKAYRSKLIFTGKGVPPIILANDAAVLSNVAGDVKAIGYIDSVNVDASVKVVMTF